MTHTKCNLHIEMPQYEGHVGFIDKRNIDFNERHFGISRKGRE